MYKHPFVLDDVTDDTEIVWDFIKDEWHNFGEMDVLNMFILVDAISQSP